MSDLLDKVVQRSVLAHFISEDTEAPAPGSLVRKTDQMFGEVRSGVIRHMKSLDRSQSAERQALQKLLRGTHDFGRRSATTVGAERDLQLHLLVACKHLENDVIDSGAVMSDSEAIGQFLT